MRAMSVKEYLSLKMPTEDAAVSDSKRIRLALETLGYANVRFPLHILRQLYPLCRNAGFDITVTLADRQSEWVVTALETGDTRQHHYGLAVDYGSTTVLMQLVDLNSGAVIGEERMVNGQADYGSDILSRITWAMEDAANGQMLQRATAETFNTLIAKLTESTGIDGAKCAAMVVSGNTTMIHFLLGLDAWPVFASPYAPVSCEADSFWGRELGMDFAGLVYLIPAASNYIGGDIISGILALDMHKRDELSMFFDIGTNGELVLGNRQWLMAGAGAAGPALEGYISRFGMRAAPGAIEKVEIHGQELRYSVIGGGKPVGICGSGIIDLLAQMRLNGWMNIAGELQPQASPRIRYLDGEYVAVYATEEETGEGPLYFSQTDIRQYLDTKAAAYTMIQCLLESAGVSVEELEKVYLSGAFCAHSDLDAAITVGIFPDLPRQRYTALRNTSLAGARSILLDRERMREAAEVAENMYCVQFASVPDFLVRMQAAKFVPHTDMATFPQVAAQLQQRGYGL